MTERITRAPALQYEVTHGEFALPEGTTYRSCGIAALCGGVPLDAVEDLDPDEEFVTTLARRLNEGEAALCHFREILENELALRY